MSMPVPSARSARQHHFQQRGSGRGDHVHVGSGQPRRQGPHDRGWGGDADGAGGRELHERLVEHSAEHPAVDGDGHRLPGWLERQHKPADGGDVNRLGSPEWVAHVHAAQLLVVCDGHGYRDPELHPRDPVTDNPKVRGCPFPGHPRTCSAPPPRLHPRSPDHERRWRRNIERDAQCRSGHHGTLSNMSCHRVRQRNWDSSERQGGEENTTARVC